MLGVIDERVDVDALDKRGTQAGQWTTVVVGCWGGGSLFFLRGGGAGGVFLLFFFLLFFFSSFFSFSPSRPRGESQETSPQWID